MRKFSHVLAGIAIILVILACNLPSSNPTQQAPGAIMTAAALTVQAQLPPTPTATFTSVAPLTPTTVVPTVPVPTLPASPTPICDGAQFITDVTYPDNTVVTGGAAFTKTWRLKNIGACSWTTSYALVFTGGESMSGPAAQALTGSVNPGQTVDISVNLTAPSGNGTYTGNWGLRNASGIIFKHFYVMIKVAAVVPPTLPPAIVFAVTSVTYSVSTWSSGASVVNCPRVTANITTNGAGTITYTWTSTSGTNSPATLVFGSAGTQSINYDWQRGSVWAGTDAGVGIYIDAPNHQDFGKQHFTTACTTP